ARGIAPRERDPGLGAARPRALRRRARAREPLRGELRGARGLARRFLQKEELGALDQRRRERLRGGLVARGSRRGHVERRERVAEPTPTAEEPRVGERRGAPA